MKKLFVALLAVLLLVGCTPKEDDHKKFDVLHLQFVPSRPAEEILTGTSELGDLIIAGMKEKGYDIVAGDLRGEPFYRRRKAKDRLCVVIGNEGQGVSPAVFAESTLRLKLPMVGGAESLNAAVAGAIMMYDFLRERMI